MQTTTLKRHYLIALIPPFMGAVSYVLSKYIINDISPVALSFYRWLVAVAILTPFFLKQSIREWSQLLRNLKISLIAALSGVTFFSLLVYYSLQYTSSTNTSIIVNSFPVIVLILGVFLNNEKLERSTLFAMIISFTGVLTITSHGDISSCLAGLFNNKGDLLALIATFAWAIYMFAVKFKPQAISRNVFTHACFLLGLVLLLPIYLYDILYLNSTIKFFT